MKLLALFCVFVAVYAKHEEYAGYKSYIVAPLTKDQLKAVGSMKIDFELDFLSIPALDRDGLIIVRPEHQDAFTKALDAAGVPYRVHVDDIVAALQKDDEMIEARHQELRMARGEGVSLPYDNYHRLEVIEKYLDDMARRFPDRATVISPATTFEGRPIKVLKISTTNFEDQTKPVIFVDAAIHAREWITPPTVTWAIHNLLENVTDPDLVENYDWILIPVLNPDGYEYTHEVMRFWRKNRSVLPSPIHRRCPGIDGNRNFGYRWNTVGVSDEPCSDIYPGRAPFSEAETVVVRDLLHEHLDRVALYIALHSFGSMIIHSWSNAASPPPDNIEDLSSVGTTMVDAIMESQPPYFPQYVVGDTFNLLNYEASGSAEDYALSIGVPLAYIYELPGFGFGMLDGFNVHPRFIKQISIDTWAGIAAGAKHAGKLFRDSKK